MDNLGKFQYSRQLLRSIRHSKYPSLGLMSLKVLDRELVSNIAKLEIKLKEEGTCRCPKACILDHSVEDISGS